MKVYEFIYNCSTCESVPATVSIHKTIKGAEMAMEFHKAEAKKIIMKKVHFLMINLSGGEFAKQN